MVGLTITRHETATGGEYRAHPADSEALGQLTWTTQAGNPAVHRADLVLVPSEIGGRGIAGRLVEAMVADARENHFRIEPLCSYVVAAFARHPDGIAAVSVACSYADLEQGREFLPALRSITERYGALLIYDESCKNIERDMDSLERVLVDGNARYPAENVRRAGFADKASFLQTVGELKK